VRVIRRVKEGAGAHACGRRSTTVVVVHGHSDATVRDTPQCSRLHLDRELVALREQTGLEVGRRQLCVKKGAAAKKGMQKRGD
jgi:hypothetical protein